MVDPSHSSSQRLSQPGSPLASLARITDGAGEAEARARMQAIAPLDRMLGSHLGGFLEVVCTLPRSPQAVVTGFHDDAYRTGWRALVAEAAAPEVARAVLAWEAEATGRGVAQRGLKWPLVEGGAFEVYLIGRFDPAWAIAPPGEVDAMPSISDRAVVRDLLEATGKREVYMVGLEIASISSAATAAPRRAVYSTMASDPGSAAAVRRAAGALIDRWLAGTPWPARWPAIAPRIIRADRAQTVFISVELGRPAPRSIKIDVGELHLAELLPVAARLGLGPTVVRAAEAELVKLEIRRTEHTGIRLLPDGNARMSLYARWPVSV